VLISRTPPLAARIALYRCRVLTAICGGIGYAFAIFFDTGSCAYGIIVASQSVRLHNDGGLSAVPELHR